MELIAIGQVAKEYKISTRTLRYYEEIGLLSSKKKEDYAYRVYDEEAIRRLQQIIVLRKLRIPLKQIASLLESEKVTTLIEIFQENLNELNHEITAIATLKSVIETFLKRLKVSTQLEFHSYLLNDQEIITMIHSLPSSKINLKEKTTMDSLNKAEQNMKKLKDKDVRVIYIPPSTVASFHYIGNTPEEKANIDAIKFIKDTSLHQIKPDFRQFGFNHPDGENSDGSDHGYEVWLTIPKDLKVKESVVKKTFKGGLYAAHMIPFGAFEEWQYIIDWASHNDVYEPVWGNPQCMVGLLEEHLNIINLFDKKPEEKNKVLQLDLLVPIKEK